MEIYRNFTMQTDFVVAYLGTARRLESQTRVEVPNLKHAPVNLGKQLEDYLADPDFEINRRQYLAEQEAKKGRGGGSGPSQATSTSRASVENSRAAAAASFPEPKTVRSSAPPVQQRKGPDPDLIDFFDSIEQNQQPMAAYPQQNMAIFASQPQYQQPFQQPGFGGYPNPNQFQPQQFNNGFQQLQQNGQQSQQLQSNYTGAGFGGYGPQSFQSTPLPSIPQNSTASFASPTTQPYGALAAGQQQSTNPFRQSVISNVTLMSGSSNTSSPPISSPISAQSTNPFKSNLSQQSQPFSQTVEAQFQQTQQGSAMNSPFQPIPTGTNPFVRNVGVGTQSPPIGTTLVSQSTGTTNPFRQSAFVNTATGSGWQNNVQPIGGGFDNLETIPVFPRPAQQQPWQQ